MKPLRVLSQDFSTAVEMLCSTNSPIDPILLGRIRLAAYAGTLTILRNENDDAVGFVCWSGGNKDSVKIAVRFNLLPSHFWEFSEGRIALLLFVFFMHPFNQEAKKAFTSFLQAHRAVYYVKRNRKRLLIRTSKGFKPAKRQ